MARERSSLIKNGEKLLPLLGEAPDKFLIIWHQKSQKVKYRKLYDYDNDFEEISIDADDLSEVKKKISQHLQVTGWSNEQTKVNAT